MVLLENGDNAHVAFGGDVFRVFAQGQDGIRLIRVTPDGVVVDPGGIRISEWFGIGDVACAADGSCATIGAAVTRVEADGTLGARLAIPPAWGGRIVRTADRYQWVHTSAQGTFVASVDDAVSSRLSRVQLTPSTFDNDPELAARADGTTIVTWCTVEGLRWAVVDESLTRVVPDGHLPGRCGAGLLVTGRGFALVDPQGQLLEVDLADSSLREATLAWGAQEFGGSIAIVAPASGTATWIHRESFMGPGEPFWASELFATPVDLADLAAGAPQLLSIGAAPQRKPRAAGGAAGHAVAFRDLRRGWNDDRDRLRLFDEDGAPIPGASVELSSRRAGRASAVVARTAEHTVVAWTERDDSTGQCETLVRRYRGDGSTPDDAATLVNEDCAENLVVTATDEAILVATQLDETKVHTFAVNDGLVPRTPLSSPGSVTAAAVRGDEIWVRHRTPQECVLSRFDRAGELIAATTPIQTCGGEHRQQRRGGCRNRRRFGEQSRRSRRGKLVQRNGRPGRASSATTGASGAACSRARRRRPRGLRMRRAAHGWALRLRRAGRHSGARSPPSAPATSALGQLKCRGRCGTHGTRRTAFVRSEALDLAGIDSKCSAQGRN